MSRKTISKLSGIALGIVGFINTANGQTFNVSWDGAASGLYSTGVNWSTNVVPLNNAGLGDFYNVTINRTGGTTVTGDVGSGSILNLTIGANAGNHLQLVDTAAMSIIGVSGGGAATVNNQGTISLGSTIASTAQLLLNGTTANLTGGGTINLLGTSILGGAGTVTSNNTIAGAGNIGNNALAFVNNGTITASGGNLTLDPRTLGGLDNNGLMQALSGGTLILSGNGGGAFDNAGGTISVAAAGGRINLVDGAAIVGGTIQTAGLNSSIFFVPGGETATLNGVTNAGDVNVGVTATMNLFGTMTNNLRIRTNSSVGVATFNVGSSTVTLNGTGSLLLSQLTGALGNVVGTGTLVNGVDHEIVGAGSIGNNTMVIRNNGLMGSSNVGSLTIDPTDTGTGFFNAGTLHAGASLMILGDGVYSNTGTIESDGQLFIQDVTINGGTLQTSAASVISKVSGAMAAWNSVHVNNSGSVIVSVGTLSVGTSSINNDGIVSISANTVDASLAVTAGTLTLAGGGEVSLATGGAGVPSLLGVGTLNNTDNLIHGLGVIGGNTLRIFNAGTISADVNGATLTLDPAGVGGLTNTGTLEARNGGILVLTGNGGGGFSTGTVSAAGGTVQLTGGAVVVVGTLRSDAGSRVQVASGQTGGVAGVTNLGDIVNADGTLTLNSNITNNGTITVGGGTSAATVALVGIGATLNGTGRMELGPTGTGTVIVGGVGTLTNGPSHLIRGRGELGNNAIPIVNNGRIESATPASPLVINPSVAGMTNNGTITADNAQIVLTGLGGGAIDNTNGRIIATSTIIRLEDGVAINGGTLGGSVFRVFGGESTTLTGINNTGYILADNNGSSDGTISLAGTINNIGTFEIRSANSGHKARLLMTGGTVTLNGGGTIILSGNGDDSSIEGTFINTNNLIRGDGDIFGGTIINQSGGVISADVGTASLRIIPGSFSPLQNAGLMRATNGGILQLESVFFGGGHTNTGAGTMLAENGSTLRLETVGVSGGTLLTSGTGTIDVNSSSLSSLTLNGHVVHDSGTLSIGTLVTNNGLIETSNNNIEIATIVNSALVNNGTMTLNPGTFISSQILGGGSLTNTGVMSGSFRIDPSGTSSFTIANSGVIESSGVGATAALENQGATPLAITANHTGIFRANSGGTFMINTGVLVNGNGTVDVRSGATFITGGTVTFGNTIVDGNAIVANSANLGRAAGVGTLNAGFFFGLGTLTGNVTVTHSRVATVNLFNGSTITTTPGGGTLGTSRVTTLSTINGGTGAFTGRWDLTNHDLVVDYSVGSPFATILGLVQTGFAGGAWTGNGLTSSAAQAAASTSDKTGLAIVEAGELFPSFPRDFSGQSIDSTTVLVKYTLLGDANLDSTVNITDFAALAANFNTGGRWNRGDFNYDSLINIGDFALLASNFNKSLPADLPRGASVPEPAVAAIGLAALVAAKRSRRRK